MATTYRVRKVAQAQLKELETVVQHKLAYRGTMGEVDIAVEGAESEELDGAMVEAARFEVQEAAMKAWKARSTKNGNVFCLVASGRGWTNRRYFKAVDGRGELMVKPTEQQEERLKLYGAVRVEVQELDVRVWNCRRDGTIIEQPFIGMNDVALRSVYGIVGEVGNEARAVGVEEAKDEVAQ